MTCHRKSPRKQKGVVLVVALFIVALAATMAYIMMARVDRDTNRTLLLSRNAQAEQYVVGSVLWAKDTLMQNWEKQKDKKDVLIDSMPIRSPEQSMEEYTIVSTIEDVQARFNLNNLKEPTAQESFQRLLKAVVPAVTDQQARDLTKAFVDWLSPVQQLNEYNQYYLALKPPYRAAHRPMANVSELKLVKGMTPAWYQALLPFVTALPKDTMINVQTAPAEVLMTLSPALTLSTAKTIVALRRQQPIVSPQAFSNLDIIKNHGIAADKIVTVSQYFLLETKVKIEDQEIVFYTLLERLVRDGKATTNSLWQSKGLYE